MEKVKEGVKNVLDFKCKEIPHGGEVEKLNANPQIERIKESSKLDKNTDIVTMTPEKTNEVLRGKCEEESVELPEKYKMILEIFERMNCSLRLLRLCNKLPTFQNISTQVEVLTKRKFSYRHLAQIKYLLPEAVQIDKILVHDERTLCMKPDMKIALLFDVIDDHQEKSAFTALSQLFASRVLKFYIKHPQDCDIPEATLPGPFNQKSETITSEALLMDSSIECQPTLNGINPLSASLHSSLSRHFSERTFVAKTEKTQLSAPAVPLSPMIIDCVKSHDIKCSEQENSPHICSGFDINRAPQLFKTQDSTIPPVCDSPVVKLTLESDNLMVETPALSTPKRSMPSCDKNLETTSTSASSEKPAKRFLDFSLLEDNEIVTESLTLPQVEEGEDFVAKDLKSDKNGPETCLNVFSWLPELVTTVHQIFQTVNRSPITKEELVHKIIINSFDIIEKGEVEEQIAHLEKLVPDWIFRRMTPSGDLLYSIKEVADLNMIRTRVKSM